MNSGLITCWADHDLALREVVSRASMSLRIYDEDLSRLQLEQPEISEILRRYLISRDSDILQIIVRNAGPFKRNSPRLMNLLSDYPERMCVYESPEGLAMLNDAFLIADDKHALIRFHKDNVRSKLILDTPEECQPYVNRFQEILNEGGEQISATTLGL